MSSTMHKCCKYVLLLIVVTYYSYLAIDKALLLACIKIKNNFTSLLAIAITSIIFLKKRLFQRI